MQTNPALCDHVNRIRLQLLQFGHAAVDVSWNGRVRNPVYSRLYHVIRGSARIVSAKQSVTLTAGNWYLLPAGWSFDYECEQLLEHVFFHVKLCGLDGIDLLRNCSTPIALKAEEDFLPLFLRCLKSGDPIDGLKVQQAVFSLLLTMLEAHSIPIKTRELSPCVAMAVQYIAAHLSAQLTIEEIAAGAYVSKSTLIKHFKRELGMSVHAYLQDAVFFEAGQLLLRSNMSVQSVSETLGFSDQFYFSKCFKQKFSITPREYRKGRLI